MTVPQIVSRTDLRSAAWCLAAPTLIAMINVIAVYSLMPGHWSAIVRPLIVSAVAATLLSLVVLALVRRTNPAAAISTTAVLILTSHPFGLLGAIAIVGWAIRRHWRRMHQRSVTPFPGTLPGRIAATLLPLSLAWMWVGGAVTWDDVAVVPGGASASSANDIDTANIYLLLLDAYPRADTLQSVFGHDNGPFEDALTDQGFTIYPQATSPTTRTERTLLSMLSGPRQVSGPEPEGWAADGLETLRRETRRAFDDAEGVRAVRDAGYRLVYIAGMASHVWLTDWDTVIHPGQLNDVEVALIRQSTALRLLLGDWVLAQHRASVELGLKVWADQGGAPGQRVVLAHITAPHAPLIYGTGPPECWSAGCNLWGYDEAEPDFPRQYTANLETLNSRILARASSLVATDPGATVIMLSDHGLRDGQEPDEWRRSFLAARGTAIFEDDPTVAHLLHRLAAEVKGGN